MTIDEAKTQLSELVERAGQGADIVIVAADGRRVRLVPVDLDAGPGPAER